ncbi:S9 family peptidase [Planctomycetota bacterium]
MLRKHDPGAAPRALPAAADGLASSGARRAIAVRGRIGTTVSLVAVLATASATIGSAQERTGPKPPVAKKVPVQIQAHDEVRLDPYAWLRDRTDPDVLSYLEAENAYTEAVMGETKELQDKLFQEYLARIEEDDATLPCRYGPYLYYSRTETGKEYRIHARKLADQKSAAEEIILDENALAGDGEYLDVGYVEPSPDHRLLAFTKETSGNERYTLYVKDLQTGKLLADRLHEVDCVVWANDNRTLFYTVLDHTNRPHKVFAHRLGADPQTDRLLLTEDDEAFYLDLDRTRSGCFVVVSADAQDTSEVHLIDADRPEQTPTCVRPRKKGVEYSVGHHERNLYVLTNEDAVNFKLMLTATPGEQRGAWDEVLAHRPETLMEGFDLFRRHLVVYERTGGVQQLRVRDLRSGREHVVEFEEEAYSLESGDNYVYDTSVLRFSYESLLEPPSTYDYDMENRHRVLKKREIVHHYDAARYRSERLLAESTDGARVPILLVSRRGLARDGRAPLYLLGYGAYGSTSDAYFSWTRISLLDRGFSVAYAQVRGGGELGRPWYDAGKLLRKKNTFIDFIAAGEHLVDLGFTSEDRLVIGGASAGGLLIGAVLNMRPDLFAAAVLDVPFVDAINTMSDPSLPLTVSEYDEWGNPADRTFYEAMRAYSPYENIGRRSYPHILVTAGLNDTRVGYWEPCKWAARLRAQRTDQNLLLLKTNMGSGHSGAAGRYDGLREVAFEHAFLLHVLGMVGEPSGPGVRKRDGWR